jgi:AbiJ N-terminal domain 3
MPSTDLRYSDAAADIWQHMVNNSDWTLEKLLVGRLRLIDSGDEIFLKFLEAYVHPLVRKDQEDQRNAVEWLNPLLSHEGLRFVRSDDSPWGTYAIQPFTGSGTGAIPVHDVVLSLPVNNGHTLIVSQALSAKPACRSSMTTMGLLIFGERIWRNIFIRCTEERLDIASLISSDYAQKVWTSHERRSAFDAAIAHRVEFILPVRFDNVEMSGLMRSVHYVSAQQYGPEKLAELILQKLGSLP